MNTSGGFKGRGVVWYTILLALFQNGGMVASSWAATVTWQTAGGTWQSGGQGGFAATYNDGDAVVFGNSGVGTVNVSGSVSPGSIAIQNTSGTYTITNGTIAGAGTTLTMSGAGGTAQISETTTLGYSGDTTVSGGTLQFRRNAAGTHNLGSGTVNLQGGTLALAGNVTGTLTVQNNFSVSSAGGTLDFSRINLNPVWNLTGTLSLGGPLTLYTASGGTGTAQTFFTGGITVQADAAITNNNSANSDWTLGAISGASSRTLTLSSINTAYRLLSVATANPFSGHVVISGPSSFTYGGGILFSAAPTTRFASAADITVKDNGLLDVNYAVGSSDLSNVTLSRGGGLKASQASGSFASLSDPMGLVGQGGGLVLDNESAANNRLSDSYDMTLHSTRLCLIGRNANTTPVTETIASLTLGGGGVLTFYNPNTSSSGVDLSVNTLGSPSAGTSLLIESRSGYFGAGAANNTIVVTGTGANKPAVSNGMIAPGIQAYDSGNTVGNFLTFSGDELVSAAANYTGYAGDWSAASASTIVNLTAATTLTGSGTLSVYALRSNGSFNQALGGRTISVGSGGVILGSGGTWSNGTLDFGGNPGMIGCYNAAGQTTLSSAILSGSGSITILPLPGFEWVAPICSGVSMVRT